jgi:3D (Asp-Asp-Asp) domain-containing protein
MSFNQQNMRLIKLAGTAAIFGALTLSGCKSNKENDANDQELNTVYNGQKELCNKYIKEYNTAVTQMRDQPKKENYHKTALTATVYSANEKHELKYQRGTLVGYYADAHDLAEADIAAANDNPSNFKYGRIVAVKKKGQVIDSDENENKDELEYVFTQDVERKVDPKTLEYLPYTGTPLKRKQFLVDESKRVKGTKTCEQIQADFRKDLKDLKAKHEKAWSKMGSLKNEKKTKIADKQKNLLEAQYQCFDMQGLLNYDGILSPTEYDAAEVKRYHEGVQDFYKAEMSKFTKKMEEAKTKVTADNHDQCVKVDAEFVKAFSDLQTGLFPDASKRQAVKAMVSGTYVKNFDFTAAMKFWDMNKAAKKQYNIAKADCEARAEEAANGDGE